MLSTVRRQLILGWLLLSALAAGVASLSWPAAHLGDELLPVGIDSFYHARRVLDTAQDPSSFYEFDTKIHAPEGSLLTWPWGYDYALGWMVRLGMELTPITNPMAILIWIPVAAVFASVGLTMLLVRRLGLSVWSTALTGLCVALSPLTQYLHGVGIIDHHYAEYIFILLSLASGLHWCLDLTSVRRALIVAVTLGLAPAIHNGLFVLQIPLLATLLLLWLQGVQLPRRPAVCFGITLVAASLAILIPSLPFRLGRFEYYTLSWFHLYVACGTAIITAIVAHVRPNRRGFASLGTAAVLLLAPLAHQILSVHSFLAGTSIRLGDIYEMRSLRRQISSPNGFREVSALYSFFVWLIPVTFALCLWKGWQERCSGRLFFWLSALCGLAMLTAQYRLQYFGSFALYLPWFVLVEAVVARWPQRRKFVMLIATLAATLLYSWTLRYQLAAPWLAANDSAFSTLRPIFTSLRDACAKHPGVVLADNDAGHYIRYYTECSVIANNFLLTQQHGDKIREMDRLMAMHARDLPAAAPYVRYVLIRPINIVRLKADDFRYVSYSPRASKLIFELLMNDRSEVDSRFKLLDEIRLPESNDIPYARLYEVQSAARGSTQGTE